MPPHSPEDNSTVRRLGTATAMLLVVANMVGTGIFTTSGFLVRDLNSPLATLFAWLVGGAFALCGALSYAELATFMPRNGGEYQLLSRIYHPCVGFVAGCISLLVGFSAPIAASALAFGKYVNVLIPSLPVTPAALLLVVVASAMHATHVAFGSHAQNFLSAAKVLLILMFIIGGFALGDFRYLIRESQPIHQAMLSPAFAIGLIYVSFSYSGWNAAAYLAGEIRRPERSLPVALFGGTAIVMALYVGLNIVFLASAPPHELAGVLEIGHVSATHLFGDKAGGLLSALIALALMSSVSSMVMAGPRVYHAMGEDYRPLSRLKTRTRHGGPVIAVLLQAAVAMLMAATASFEFILSYIGFTLSIFTGLTVVGLFVMRRRERDVPRPYKTWGYPITPGLFVLLSLWMIAHAVWQQPIAAAAGTATVLASLLAYVTAGRRPNRGTGK